ncbi:hypothetical protein ACFL35_19440 [Candidatus Riflebacteria bacterium]
MNCIHLESDPRKNITLGLPDITGTQLLCKKKLGTGNFLEQLSKPGLFPGSSDSGCPFSIKGNFVECPFFEALR